MGTNRLTADVAGPRPDAKPGDDFGPPIALGPLRARELVWALMWLLPTMFTLMFAGILWVMSRSPAFYEPGPGEQMLLEPARPLMIVLLFVSVLMTMIGVLRSLASYRIGPAGLAWRKYLRTRCIRWFEVAAVELGVYGSNWDGSGLAFSTARRRHVWPIPGAYLRTHGEAIRRWQRPGNASGGRREVPRHTGHRRNIVKVFLLGIAMVTALLAFVNYSQDKLGPTFAVFGFAGLVATVLLSLDIYRQMTTTYTITVDAMVRRGLFGNLTIPWQDVVVLRFNRYVPPFGPAGGADQDKLDATIELIAPAARMRIYVLARQLRRLTRILARRCRRAIIVVEHKELLLPPLDCAGADLRAEMERQISVAAAGHRVAAVGWFVAALAIAVGMGGLSLLVVSTFALLVTVGAVVVLLSYAARLLRRAGKFRDSFNTMLAAIADDATAVGLLTVRATFGRQKDSV